MAGETLLLVEDNDAVALGLKYGLEQQGYKIIRVDTVKSAREQARLPLFDLVILDIRLPDGSGFDLCRELRNADLHQPIIMLTARDDTVDKVIGLEMGADDYVTKPFELQELIARIRALLRRSYGALASDESQQINVGDLSIHLDTQKVFRQGGEIHLTPIEFKLLVFLAQYAGQTIGRDSLYKVLWGYEDPKSEVRTLDVHVRNLRQKIELEPAQPRIIATVRGAGYRINK
jgi:DNA-binding response OmpR family regulator